MSSLSKKTVVPGGVEEYISECPVEIQDKLKQIRASIRDIAPDAIETVSYFGIPGYCYEGYDYNGMFAWFSYKKPHIRLHVRPPVAEDHRKELTGCKISTGIIGFPEEKEISTDLIKKLVLASLTQMKSTPTK
jgi:uncharacterized protein YdhG (YjbR/CyaY superfamily)